MPEPLQLVATCSLGLEELLAGELSSLGVVTPRIEKGAVRWQGGWASCWRANWRLRTANRVLIELGSWRANHGDALAAGAASLVAGEIGSGRWAGLSAHRLFEPTRTLSVRASSSGSKMRDVRWVALKVKDGLVDAQRERYGKRSSVDRDAADLPLRVRLARDRATLLLDTSGQPLDKRGYRKQVVSAPLREQLAAACVLAADWDGQGAIADPMCGSGTLLAEAAWIAEGKAPGELRWQLAQESGTRAWAFEGFPGFSAERFAAVRAEPVPALSPEPPKLYGWDLANKALNATESNLRRAGLWDQASLLAADAFELDAPAPNGLMLLNPPYGERIAEDPEQWKRLGDLFKQKWSGWRAVVVAGDAGKGKFIGLRPMRRIPIKNGALDARILVFDLY